MANEAVLVSEPSVLNPVQRTIANGSSGTDVLKNTLMVLSDPNTVAASSGSADEFGGILAFDKEGGDGSTLTSCHMNGQWDITLAPGASCTVGEQVTISGANLIRAATEAEVQLGQWIGNADEAGSSNEVVLVTLRGG